MKLSIISCESTDKIETILSKNFNKQAILIQGEWINFHVHVHEHVHMYSRRTKNWLVFPLLLLLLYLCYRLSGIGFLGPSACIILNIVILDEYLRFLHRFKETAQNCMSQFSQFWRPPMTAQALQNDSIRLLIKSPTPTSHRLFGLQAAPRRTITSFQLNWNLAAESQCPHTSWTLQSCHQWHFWWTSKTIRPPTTRTRSDLKVVAALPPTLKAANFVYIRKGGGALPLSPPYDDLYAVVAAWPKFFSADRLKPSHWFLDSFFRSKWASFGRVFTSSWPQLGGVL
jgi:hypothetical protein